MKSAAVDVLESQKAWDFDDKMENYDPIIPGVKDYADDQTLAPTSTSSAAKKTLSPKAIENQKLTKRLGEIKTIKKKKANGETLDADEELKLASEAKTKKQFHKMCNPGRLKFIRDKSSIFKPKSGKSEQIVVKSLWWRLGAAAASSDNGAAN